MGRTLQTTTQLILGEQTAFASFRRTLRREDQHLFDRLFASARKHTAAISQAKLHERPMCYKCFKKQFPAFEFYRQK